MRFLADQVVETVGHEQISMLTVVGDAVGRPLADTLERSNRTDLDCLERILSSGAMLTEVTKRRIIDRLPRVAVIDQYGSTEAIGLGSAVSTAAGIASTGSLPGGPRRPRPG